MYNIYTSRTYLYKENKQLKETIKEMSRERTDLINNMYEQGKAYNYVAKKYEERIKHMSDRIDNLLTMCADLKAQLKIKEKTND